DAQHRPVDRGQPGHGPAGGDPPGQLGVDALAVGVDPQGQLDRQVVRPDRQLGQHVLDGDALGLGLVEQLEGPLARRPPALRTGGVEVAHGHGPHARVRYSPVRVSTLMRSPGLTNSGTWTTRPVSRVAGLRAPDTRSPWTPGSVSVTASSTAAGRSVPMISSR